MVFQSKSDNRLKTNLKLAAQRLKLLERKKTENALKARQEIADYLKSGKIDRARIRVEHIIREDYCVEAMELLEMFVDTLLARFDLFLSSKNLIGSGLEEAVSSVLWACARLVSQVPELRKVTEGIERVLGKVYVDQCLSDNLHTVSEKLIAKLSVEAPSKLLVEQYLVEIAKTHRVKFSPDPGVMAHDQQWNLGKRVLIDFKEASAPSSINEFDRFDDIISTKSDAQVQTHEVTPEPEYSHPIIYDALYPAASAPQPTQPSHIGFQKPKSDDFTLPSVPNTKLPPQSSSSNRELGLDFDELNKRFEELKKRR